METVSFHFIFPDTLQDPGMTPLLQELPRKINFLEVKEYYLDYFIRVKSSAVKGKPFRRRFNAITTTSNEVCLFPIGGPEPTTIPGGRTPSISHSADNVDLCKKIAFCYLTADQTASTNVENGSSARRKVKIVDPDVADTMESTDTSGGNDDLNLLSSGGKHKTPSIVTSVT